MDSSTIFDVSCGHSLVDGESNGSKMSLDQELGIHVLVTPSARKSVNVVKTLRGDPSIHRSTHAKYPIDRLTYDGALAHHYAYIQGSKGTKANLF